MKVFKQLFAAGFVLLALTACGGGSSTNTPAVDPAAPTTLVKTDTLVGTGVEASAGKAISVNYTGWLYSATAAGNKGTQFDSNAGRSPFAFTLGVKQVIEGWDQGIVGMKVGGKRTLVIPPALAYGTSGNGSIPGNAVLVFDVELLSVR